MAVRLGVSRTSFVGRQRYGIRNIRSPSKTATKRLSSGAAEEASLAGGNIGFSPRPTNAQLMRLCGVTAVPFVGFGFADNFIMILAGDAIDQTLGVQLGISTMAAAGLGNLLSDIVGLGAGDVIEGWCNKMGFKGPPLTAMQKVSKVVRRTKSFAMVIGMSVGCIIGMCPLLFLTDRKKIYFNEKELLLFESFFQPFGVTSPDYFDLMATCKWKVAEPGSVIVPSGKIMDRVILIHTGTASAYCQESLDKPATKLYTYVGRTQQKGSSDEIEAATAATTVATKTANMAAETTFRRTMTATNEDTATVRGSIIGGSALMMDVSVLKVPYPNTVKATSKCEYVEWSIHELKEQMNNNKAVKAAMFSTLYLDLVEGLRRKFGTEHNVHQSDPMELTPSSPGLSAPHESWTEFSILMRAVLADGIVHPTERQMVREFVASKGLSSTDLKRVLQQSGWSAQEWELGKQKDWDAKSEQGIEDRIKELPGMLKKAGIRSRASVGGASSPPQQPPVPSDSGVVGDGGHFSK